MKTIVLFAFIISSGFAAPLDAIEDVEDLHRSNNLPIEDIEELLRTKKSYGTPLLGGNQLHNREDEHDEEQKARAYLDASINLGGPTYGSGLSTSAIASAGGSYSPIPSSASYSGASSAGGYGAASGGYAGAQGASHSFVSNSYGAHSGGYGSGAYGSHGAVGAVGLFPHAYTGGCNVPLLLSCAPNVVSGHLAESHSYSHPAPAYRSFEEDMRKEAEWAQARKASHHKVSEDYPEPHPGNHHVVSQDYPQPNLVHVVPHTQTEQATKN